MRAIDTKNVSIAKNRRDLLADMSRKAADGAGKLYKKHKLLEMSARRVYY